MFASCVAIMKGFRAFAGNVLHKVMYAIFYIKSYIVGENMIKDKDFWNKRARSFPGHRDGDTYQAKVLEIIEKNGVSFDGLTVLDLGCGSGAYSIRLAKKAKILTALDISDGMLENLKKSAEENGIKNIEYINADWSEYFPDKKFDIIFASLTPALKDENSVEKVINYSKKWFINIVFASPMTNDLLQGLFEIHNLEQKSRNKFEPVAENYFIKNNLKFSKYFLKGQWETLRNYEEMTNNCYDIIKAHGEEPNMEKIEKYIENFKDKETGMYISKNNYDVEIITYNVS